MDLILIGFTTLAGVFVGYGISWDLSNHPMFPAASGAFVFFWAVAGGFIGYVISKKITDHFDLDL